MEGQAAAPRKNGMTSPRRMPGGTEHLAEKTALSVLYQRYMPHTLRWLWLCGVAPRHRPDVAQETWIRVYRNLDRFDGARPFEPWLMTITCRAACDHLKRADVRRERLSEAGEVDVQSTAPADERRIDATRILKTLLQKLTPEHREVLLMVDIEEIDSREAALALGVPVNTVHSRLSRARTQLRRGLERLRASEERRSGAAFVVPAFLCDWRALLAIGKESEPPVSHPPAAPGRLAVPSALRKAARWMVSGLVGAGLAYVALREPVTPPPAIVHQEAQASAVSDLAAPPSTVSTPAAIAPAVLADAGAPVYDPREELSTLESAWTLYVQGQCQAASAKLGRRTGRAHAQDYRDLRKKIAACLAGDGGSL